MQTKVIFPILLNSVQPVIHLITEIIQNISGCDKNIILLVGDDLSSELINPKLLGCWIMEIRQSANCFVIRLTASRILSLPSSATTLLWRFWSQVFSQPSYLLFLSCMPRQWQYCCTVLPKKYRYKIININLQLCKI